MKSALFLSGAGLVLLLAGCASTPVALAPVGPNPAGSKSMASNGELEVFSRLVGRSEGEDPTWHQHSDYEICDADGNLLKRVGNTIGYYEKAPREVALPPGRYIVKAEARDYPWVKVPVDIEGGRTTRVHLDDDWKPAVNTPDGKLVNEPNGTPIGWRAGDKLD